MIISFLNILGMPRGKQDHRNPRSCTGSLESTLQNHQGNSVAQLCPTVCNPMDCSMPGLPIHHQLPKLAQTQGHRAGDAMQPSHPLSPLLLLPSIFPSIRIFSNESALCIRWPNSIFSFSISPSNEYSELISFRTNWFVIVFFHLSSALLCDGKESSCNAGDLGSISGLGRSPGEGNGNPLQYSCLEDPMDREPGRL